MLQSLDISTLIKYVSKQLNNLLPDTTIATRVLAPFVKKAIERAEYCFAKNNSKYLLTNDGQLRFNHLDTDQYATFLYFLSNTIWRQEKNEDLASRIYYLNKALHGLDAFYEVNLPDIFRLVHPIGTVFGRAAYKNYFVAYQRVTVGRNRHGEYPVLGEGVAMYGGSALIGRCNVGNNCLISAGTIVINKDIASNMVAFNHHGDISYKKTKKSVIERYFGLPEPKR